MNLDVLLASHGDAGPSGENLEYDADFIMMEIAAQPGQERQAGEEIIAAQDPDYADVVAKAMAVMERSHDLRAGVILAGAILNTDGISGFADATGYLRGCLEQYWDTCHPQLDPDDDNDPTMRINAIKGLGPTEVLGGNDLVLRSLRRAPLTRSRTFGRLSLRDIQIAHGEIPPVAGQTTVDKPSVKAAFEDSSEEFITATLAAARASLANLKAIDKVFATQTPGFGPDLDETVKAMQQIVRLMGEYVQTDAPAVETGATEEDEDMPADAPRARAAAPRSGGGAPGVVATRDDVIAAIDAITAYYRNFEPSSPLPILLARAKRLVKADFMEIMKDMAPAGVDNVNIIGGLE